MEHGTKDPRVREYAKTYGVPIEKLIALNLRLISMYFIVLPSCLSGLTLIK